MFGQVTSYDPATGALVVNVTATGGSGTFAAWTVALSPAGAAGANIWHTLQTYDVAGTPLTISSADSTARKITLQNAGVTKGGIGTGTSGANLMDSAGTARAEVSLTGVTLTGDVSVTGTSNAIVSSTDNVNGATIRTLTTHATYTGSVAQFAAVRAGTTSYSLLTCYSANFGDAEFIVLGNGQVASDGGTAMSSPADYADMKEWADGNPDDEDRVGYSVVHVPGTRKVRKATKDDDPEKIIGIASGNPSVIGGAAWNRWIDKYLKDDFNRPIYEEYEAVEWIEAGEDEDGKPTEVLRSYATDQIPEGVEVPEGARVTREDDQGQPFTRRKLNPEYVPGSPYTPRSERPEWDPIGLVGEVPLRKGCPVNPRWEYLGDVSGTVELWHVR
jgi:hypothetical protein